LALTATATPEVVNDIQQKLNFREGSHTFRMSFERKNLAYIVRRTENKQEELIHILKKVSGSAIVYTRNRKRTREVCEFLTQQNITSTFYHAGLNNEVKDQRQKSWLTGESRVMVATNAFGMGIDKPDVRIVIHIDLPDSPEAYFQEAGRAGRDGQKAYAVLLYAKEDKTNLSRNEDYKHDRIAGWESAIGFNVLILVLDVYTAFFHTRSPPFRARKGQSSASFSDIFLRVLHMG
jgi:ATP-dependent DNA helicase RecQ